MSETTNNPYDALERIFHEPNRLAIMSALCAADGPMSFGDLKDACNLTDGNLNRHLKTLEDADAVVSRKSFVGLKPRTTVSLSRKGVERFHEYLAALEDVLLKARGTLPDDRQAREGVVQAAAVRAS